MSPAQTSHAPALAAARSTPKRPWSEDRELRPSTRPTSRAQTPTVPAATGAAAAVAGHSPKRLRSSTTPVPAAQATASQGAAKIEKASLATEDGPQTTTTTATTTTDSPRPATHRQLISDRRGHQTGLDGSRSVSAQRSTSTSAPPPPPPSSSESSQQQQQQQPGRQPSLPSHSVQQQQRQSATPSQPQTQTQTQAQAPTPPSTQQAAQSSFGSFQLQPSAGSLASRRSDNAKEKARAPSSNLSIQPIGYGAGGLDSGPRTAPARHGPFPLHPTQQQQQQHQIQSYPPQYPAYYPLDPHSHPGHHQQQQQSSHGAQQIHRSANGVAGGQMHDYARLGPHPHPHSHATLPPHSAGGHPVQTGASAPGFPPPNFVPPVVNQASFLAPFAQLYDNIVATDVLRSTLEAHLIRSTQLLRSLDGGALNLEQIVHDLAGDRLAALEARVKELEERLSRRPSVDKAASVSSAGS